MKGVSRSRISKTVKYILLHSKQQNQREQLHSEIKEQALKHNWKNRGELANVLPGGRPQADRANIGTC